MKTAEGIGAWHNQYNTMPLSGCVARAQRAQLDFVIVKYGEWEAEKAYKAVGIPWATEVYAYGSHPETEGTRLADAIDNGACFAVINAEEGPGGWGPAESGWGAMIRLIEAFCLRHPKVALYACLDTRGDRLSHPYQQAALKRCDGIMPMIYPAAFRPGRPPLYINDAFRDCLDGKNFVGKPVFPVLQSYDGGLGYSGIQVQVNTAKVRNVGAGYSFYTIHHATDAEWDSVCDLTPKPKPKPKPDPLIVAGKYITELALRVEGVKLAADGKWGELHAKLHEMKVEPA